MAGPYLGDFVEDATVHFMWDSNDSNGASITRSTDGTVSVYKDNGVTQSVAGITDTEDFDSLTGIHVTTIDTSADAFYATGSNYTVVLSAATIDTQTVNAVLAHFSIENRFTEVDVVNWSGSAVNALVSGRVDTSTGAMATDVVTAAAVATAAIDADAIASDAITAAKIATDAIDADALATDAVDEIADGVLDRSVVEPSAIFTWPASLRTIIQWIGAASRNRLTQTATTQVVRNDANSADIASSAVSDDTTTFVRGEFS